MTHLAVAVPAAPAIAWGLLDLALVIAFVVSLGLLWSWKRTMGRLFEWLGHKTISASARGIGFSIKPFGFLLSLNEEVITYLGQAAAASENAMAYAFHRMVGSIVWTGQEIAGLATDAYNAIRGVEHTAVTHVTKVIRQTVVKPITTTIKGATAITKAQFNHLTHSVDILRHQVARLTHAAGHAIATPFPRIGRIEKDLKGQAKRLGKLEKLLAAGLGVALLTKALTKIGVNYIRCDRNKQLGKGICSTSPDWVSEFLAGSILLLGTTSFVDFVKEAQDGYELGIEGLKLFIREL